MTAGSGPPHAAVLGGESHRAARYDSRVLRYSRIAIAPPGRSAARRQRANLRCQNTAARWSRPTGSRWLISAPKVLQRPWPLAVEGVVGLVGEVPGAEAVVIVGDPAILGTELFVSGIFREPVAYVLAMLTQNGAGVVRAALVE